MSQTEDVIQSRMFQIPSVEEMGGEDSPITPMFAKRQKIASPTKSTPDENSGPTTENDNTANQRTASSSAMTGSTLSSAALNSIKNTTEKLNQSSKPRADSNQVCQITSTASTSSTIHVDYKQIINAAPSASSKLRHLASSVPQPTENKPSKDLFDIKDKVDEKEQNGGVVPQRNYSGATIFALHRQKGNPILKFIRNVPVEFVNDIAPDYILSEATCALFLSIRLKSRFGFVFSFYDDQIVLVCDELFLHILTESNFGETFLEIGLKLENIFTFILTESKNVYWKSACIL